MGLSQGSPEEYLSDRCGTPQTPALGRKRLFTQRFKVQPLLGNRLRFCEL